MRMTIRALSLNGHALSITSKVGTYIMPVLLLGARLNMPIASLTITAPQCYIAAININLTATHKITLNMAAHNVNVRNLNVKQS